MRPRAQLITGANGEIGHGLIEALSRKTEDHLIGLDVHEMDDAIRDSLEESVVANILDRNALDTIGSRYDVVAVYHLAALLSSRAEFTPMTAHHVNVDGTLNLLNLAVEQARTQGRPVRFFFPSSIAAYGLLNLEDKIKAGAVVEESNLFPQTMYGCNKLYCEMLGTYHAHYYMRLSAEAGTSRVDFRSLRFPGLISAVTTPSGGTSDFAPEMIHAAAQSEPYSCFVREDTVIPFMTMPDAIAATLKLMEAPHDQLNQLIYNVRAFCPTAGQFREKVLHYFPSANIDFDVDDKRQAIVDSWPADVDQTAAEKEWGWQPKHDLDSAFEDYLVPAIREQYGK